MKTWLGFSTLILLLIIKLLQIQCIPINNPGEPSTPEVPEVYQQSQRTKYVDDVTKQLLHAIEKLKVSSNPGRRFRQDEEDDDELPELVPGILKIVGSALAGNASALIDSSISLIPEDVHSSISGALSVLVNSINSARPTKAPVRAPVKVAVSNTTASPVRSTTEEDEEDDEDKTDLRTNSSTNANISTTISIRVNDSDVTTELFPLTLSQTTPTTPLPPPSPRTNPPTTNRIFSTAAPINNNNNFGGESFDLDNKANWMSLVDNSNSNNNNNFPSNNNNINNTSSQSESFSNPIDEIDFDNKANFNSLWGQNVESPNLNIQVKIPNDATNKQNNNNNANILISSKLSVNQQKPLGQDDSLSAKPSRPVFSQSNWNTNTNPQKPQSFFSLSIRDNSKAPGQKLSNYASNQPEVILPGVPASSASSASSGIGNKLNAILLSNSKPINSFIGDKLSEKENESEETQSVKISKPVTTTSAPVILIDSRPDPTPNTIDNNNNNSNSQELSSEEEEKESSAISSSSSSPVSKSTGNAPLYSNYADKFSYSKSNVTSATSEPQLNTESTTVDDEDEEEDEDSK